MNRACFVKEKDQNSHKNGRNSSFWPFLWFGLPGRLLIWRFSGLIAPSCRIIGLVSGHPAALARAHSSSR